VNGPLLIGLAALLAAAVAAIAAEEAAARYRAARAAAADMEALAAATWEPPDYFPHEWTKEFS
jgi:hypothetical protein